MALHYVSGIKCNLCVQNGPVGGGQSGALRTLACRKNGGLDRLLGPRNAKTVCHRQPVHKRIVHAPAFRILLRNERNAAQACGVSCRTAFRKARYAPFIRLYTGHGNAGAGHRQIMQRGFGDVETRPTSSSWPAVSCCSILRVMPARELASKRGTLTPRPL